MLKGVGSPRRKKRSRSQQFIYWPINPSVHPLTHPSTYPSAHVSRGRGRLCRFSCPKGGPIERGEREIESTVHLSIHPLTYPVIHPSTHPSMWCWSQIIVVVEWQPQDVRLKTIFCDSCQGEEVNLYEQSKYLLEAHWNLSWPNKWGLSTSRSHLSAPSCQFWRELGNRWDAATLMSKTPRLGTY